MYECDVLGDRICILADGQLRYDPLCFRRPRQDRACFYAVGPCLASQRACSAHNFPIYYSTVGSSAFLKGRFGVGYHMTFVKTPTCSTGMLENVMSRHIRDADLTADVGTEVSFLLPKSNTPQFPGLFEELDANQSALGFESYGISVTTLEDVSLAVSLAVS
jgi:hypothetical protein